MFYSLFLASNTFLLTASSFTYGKRTKMVFSNIATVDLGRFGRWGFEDQKLAPRSRGAEKPIGGHLPPPPSPLPFTRVCPFSSRSTTCIIGSPYPENIHLRTLDTNTLYSIPWDNSYFPPRLSLMTTFWHCIINVCPRKNPV